MTDDNVLYVGIDLGTSRSSISASNGQKYVVDSYVGWPADMVARKIVKKEVLIGREAVDNRSMLDLHRPLERGLLKEGSEKDQEAVRQLLIHLLALAGVEQEKRTEKQVRAVVGVPAEALRVNKQQLRNALHGLVDGLFIVSEPFAVAYGLEALLHALVVDIGAGTTDLCAMHGRYPTEDDQRTLLNAGDWVDDQLFKLIKSRHPDAHFSPYMVREWKEKHSFVGTTKKPVTVQAPVNGKPTDLDITDEIRAACEGLVPPIAETMIDLIASSSAGVLVTADHGMVDVPPEGHRFYDVDPALLAGVRHAVGEPRGLQLHVDADALDDLLVAWRRWVRREATVLSRDELVASGWLGEVDARVLGRLGDVIVVARRAVAYYDSRTAGDSVRMVGQHGAATDAESLVPLLRLGAFGG